ncbi:MAG: hypothetical protein AAF368_02250 [Planctomycetota bacterium]
MKRILPFLVLALPVALASCNATADNFGMTVDAEVAVPGADGEDVIYELRSSARQQCKEAVRELRLENYEEAMILAEGAVDKAPNDDRTRFILGIAYEMMGEFEYALEQYEEATRIPNKIDQRYMESVRRVRAKLGR